MKGVRTATRSAWVGKVLGPRRKFTVRQMMLVLHLRLFEGWASAMPADGPALEEVAMVHKSNPLATVVRAYQTGTRWFERAGLEALVGARLHTPIGAQRLAMAGFAIVAYDGDRVELRAADPRTARFVNESRHRTSDKGYSARRVIEAMLPVRNPRRRRININDDRRLLAAETLLNRWSINCDDLLAGRLRVRLISNWMFQTKTPPVESVTISVGV